MIRLRSRRGSALAPAVPRSVFDHEVPLTIGVEEELLLLDPETLLPEPAIEQALACVDGDRRFFPELRAAQLELVTPVCTTAADVRRELEGGRRELVQRLAGRLRLAAVGTHPTARGEAVLTDRERYRGIAREVRWGARQGYPSGLHVHVAVPGPERALAVYNALRSYLPELAALAANSPFLEAADTGCASIRTTLNGLLGRGGVPPAFASWADFDALVHWGERGGAWPDASYLWWHLRPNTRLGTLELRVCDAQTDAADSAAVAAVWQALAAECSHRFDRGLPLPVHASERIAENVRRAALDGLDARLLDHESGRARPARERLARLLERLDSPADELGSRAELEAAWRLASSGGAAQQRALVRAEGPDGLVPWLVALTEARPLASAPDAEPARPAHARLEAHTV